MTRIATIGVGVWLFVTGVQVPYLAHSQIPQFLVALGIVVAEIIALRIDAVRWVSFVLGGWLAVAPLVLAYPGPLGALNSFAAGLVVLVLAAHPTVPATYEDPTTYNRELYAKQGGGRAYR